MKFLLCLCLVLYTANVAALRVGDGAADDEQGAGPDKTFGEADEKYEQVTKKIDGFVEELHDTKISDKKLRDTYNKVLDVLWIEWGAHAAEDGKRTGDWDDIARKSFSVRSVIKGIVQKRSSKFAQFIIQLRQWWKYGSKDGPSFEDLLAKKGGKAEEIFYSSFSSDGKDLGLTSALMNPIRKCAKALESDPASVWKCGMSKKCPIKQFKQTKDDSCDKFKSQLCESCQGSDKIAKRDCGDTPATCTASSQ